MTNENNNEFLPETEEEAVETIEDTNEEHIVVDNVENHIEEAVRLIDDKRDVSSPKQKEKSTGREILEWVLVLGVAALLAFFIRTFVFTLVEVEGNSMLPNLVDNDRLIVTRLGYEPERGDIVVFYPKDFVLDKNGNITQKQSKVAYVKRVIGIEGDTVRIDYTENSVYVNGAPIEENYIDQIMEYRGSEEEVTVPADCVFVLGDNRNNSKDSRDPSVGFVPVKSIIGKATVRIWPLHSFGMIEEDAKSGAIAWLFGIGIIIILIFVVRKFVFGFVKVEDRSMRPSLDKKDRVIVNKFRYKPGIGDVIAFYITETRVDKNGKSKKVKAICVKRIIGAQGDTLRMNADSKTIYVNGSPLHEDYIDQSLNNISLEEITVPEGCVFVLGDNRNDSKDSRHEEVGFVSEKSIIGKVGLRVWPIRSFGVIK